MRTCSLLLALAASMSAAELTLEELSRQSLNNNGGNASSDHPFVIKAGAQYISSSTTVGLNSDQFDLGEDTALRSRIDALLLVQPVQSRPGLVLGAGLSRTAVNLTDDLGATGTCLNGTVGLTFGLTSDNRWRLDLLGYAGFGWGTLAEDLSGKADEYGVELALNGPLLQSMSLEWVVSVGWGRFDLDPGSFDVVHAGTTYPANLDLSVSGTSMGLGIAWRP